MLTGETITDAMIREIWAYALDVGNRNLAKTAQVALGEWHGAHEWKSSDRDYTPACTHIGSNGRECGGHPQGSLHIRAARARCAELINARAPKFECSRCRMPVHRSWDHLDVGEHGERWMCPEILNARAKEST